MDLCYNVNMANELWTNEWNNAHLGKSEWDDGWVPKSWYSGGTYASTEPDYTKKATRKVERIESRGCSECSSVGTVMQTIDGNTFPVPCKICGGEGHIEVVIREDIIEGNTLEKLKEAYREVEYMKARRYSVSSNMHLDDSDTDIV